MAFEGQARWTALVCPRLPRLLLLCVRIYDQSCIVLRRKKFVAYYTYIPARII